MSKFLKLEDEYLQIKNQINKQPDDETINKLDKLIKHMDLDIRSNPNRDYQSRISKYKTEISSFKRLNLTSTGDTDDYTKLNSQLLQSNMDLENSKRALYETEEIGVEILTDLRGQRETMLRTSDHLSSINTAIDTSKRLLSEMSNRLVHNRSVLILVLLLVACGLLYVLFR